jgi:acyl carrier protein
MAEQQNVRETIADTINRVLTDTGRPRRQFDDQDTLTGTIGLDSLDLAVMVVALEQSLGVDPFREGAAPVQSFGELVRLYDEHQ